MDTTRTVRGLCLALLVISAGCASVLTDRETGETGETVTAVPIPTESSASVRSDVGPGDSFTEANQSRYFSLRPTCERPPGLVIQIQVSALMHNEYDHPRGINTTYQFSASSADERGGPPGNFIRVMSEAYAPLLIAERVTYGPVYRNRNTAYRNVTVSAQGEGVGATYRWVVERQGPDSGQYAGCWLTATVAQQQ